MEDNKDELTHSGIKGMKWGNRRFQYKDGSLTPAGRKRYGIGDKDGEDSGSDSSSGSGSSGSKFKSQKNTGHNRRLHKRKDERPDDNDSSNTESQNDKNKHSNPFGGSNSNKLTSDKGKDGHYSYREDRDRDESNDYNRGKQTVGDLLKSMRNGKDNSGKDGYESDGSYFETEKKKTESKPAETKKTEESKPKESQQEAVKTKANETKKADESKQNFNSNQKQNSDKDGKSKNDNNSGLKDSAKLGKGSDIATNAGKAMDSANTLNKLIAKQKNKKQTRQELDSMDDNELRKKLDRMRMEDEYSNRTSGRMSQGHQFVSSLLTAGSIAASATASALTIAKLIKELKGQ